MRQFSLRICLLADYSGPLDEGMRKTAFHLNKELSKYHEVKFLPLNQVFSMDFWKGIKGSNPQIIHYTPGPSILSFMIMRALRGYCRKAKTVISATHPSFYGLQGFRYGPYYAFSSLLKNLIPLLKPDMLLVQSYETEQMFKKVGCKTEFLPGGVDIEKFAPVSPKVKQGLRKKYRLDKEKFVILHAGSFRKWRNVQTLTKLQMDNTQVIILGNSTRVESNIYYELERSGCLVWKEYLEKVEELYQLADCYVFPTIDKRGSIELPLSVLEAMACNLPVVSTKFGALPRIFKPDGGLVFADTEGELLQEVEEIKNSSLPVRTREMVLPYDWGNVTKRLQEIYTDVIYGS